MEDRAGFTVETSDFAEIATEFHDRVASMVWCNVATVDRQCRPRSRVMHPIWDGQTGWIGAWLTSTKSGHQSPSLKIEQLRHNPFASLAYIAEITKPVYVDCTVDVSEDPAVKQRFSELARTLPEPYGYDPAQFFGQPDDPRFGVLKLTPSRIALVAFPAPPGQVIVWRSPNAASTLASF